MNTEAGSRKLPALYFEKQENNKVEELIKAGNALDKDGLTPAGRAIQKHGSRDGSVFPKATGNSSSINACIILKRESSRVCLINCKSNWKRIRNFNILLKML